MLRSVWDALDPLLELALIKRDKETGVIALHRLVQVQFQFYMSDTQRQSAFANASYLVDRRFPSRPRSSHQMYDVWKPCRLYLPHVQSLMRAYWKSETVKYKSRPTKEFCDLLTRCGRYVRPSWYCAVPVSFKVQNSLTCKNPRSLGEIGMYPEMQELLDIAVAAYHNWDERDEHPLILADLERHQSVLWLQRGNFHLSEKHMIRSLGIYEKHSKDDPGALLAPYNHMSNVVASRRRYDEAIQWQEKSERIFNDHAATLHEDAMKRVALLNCNLGRSLFLAGRVAEGKARLELAREQFTGSLNWAMLALYVNHAALLIACIDKQCL